MSFDADYAGKANKFLLETKQLACFNDKRRTSSSEEKTSSKGNGVGLVGFEKQCSCASCFLNKQNPKRGIVLPCIGKGLHALQRHDGQPPTKSSAKSIGPAAVIEEDQIPDHSAREGRQKNKDTLENGVTDDQDSTREHFLKEASVASVRTHAEEASETPDDGMANQKGARDQDFASVLRETEGDSSFLHALEQLEEHISSLRSWNQKYLSSAKEDVANGFLPPMQLDVCATLCGELVVLLHNDSKIKSDPKPHGQGGACFPKSRREV